MPITRQEFDSDRIDLGLPIFDFLKDRSDLAFSAEELRHMLQQTTGRDVGIEAVEEALVSLVSQARVHRKEIAGQRWYTGIRRRLGFLR